MPNEKMKKITQSWYNNRNRQRKFANVPTLSTEEERFAITKFLREGKGQRYPLGATLNPNFKDDKVCQSLLEQVETIDIKDG
jgi:hypothetical protein